MTLVVEGNHDAGVAEAFADDLDVIGAGGGVLGGDGGERDDDTTTGTGVGVLHGHTWPNPELLDADVVCMGHEHPQVRLEDAVGGSRVERAWLRGGELDPTAFVKDGEVDPAAATDPPELVVFPAFNERSGGTWVNVDGQSFLAPFLPDALPAGDAYLLDGTRLGDFRRI